MFCAEFTAQKETLTPNDLVDVGSFGRLFPKENADQMLWVRCGWSSKTFIGHLYFHTSTTEEHLLRVPQALNLDHF